MSNIKIELLNKKRIIKAFQDAPNDLAKAIQTALEQTGGETVRKAKQIVTSGSGMWKAPVDTGKMRQGIYISEKTPLRVVIQPNLSITPYAQFVHEGTRKMKARPFMTITKEQEGKNIASFFQRTLNNFVNELSRKIG